MSGAVAVVGCGLMTPVGLSAPETAASARARIARQRISAWQDRLFEPLTLARVPDAGLPELDAQLLDPPLTGRESRMLRLGHLALLEALRPLPPDLPPLPLLLGLPELHNQLPLKPGAFLVHLSRQAGTPLDLQASAAAPRGRAAGLLAVVEACRRLQQGKGEFILAGGVDCQIDQYLLGTLDMEQRLLTDRNPDGFTPGEGAGFVLLSTPQSAARYGLTPLATLTGWAHGREPGHLYSDEPYRGEGLAQTFQNLFQQAGDGPPVACVYASFNGERYWAREAGVALLRHQARFTPERRMEHPAECFGDLGAAHGAAMLGLACLGVQGGYRPAPTLVYSSSDRGDRAAVLLSGA